MIILKNSIGREISQIRFKIRQRLERKIYDQSEFEETLSSKLLKLSSLHLCHSLFWFQSNLKRVLKQPMFYTRHHFRCSSVHHKDRPTSHSGIIHSCFVELHLSRTSEYSSFISPSSALKTFVFKVLTSCLLNY